MSIAPEPDITEEEDRDIVQRLQAVVTEERHQYMIGDLRALVLCCGLADRSAEPPPEMPGLFNTPAQNVARAMAGNHASGQVALTALSRAVVSGWTEPLLSYEGAVLKNVARIAACPERVGRARATRGVWLPIVVAALLGTASDMRLLDVEGKAHELLVQVVDSIKLSDALEALAAELWRIVASRS